MPFYKHQPPLSESYNDNDHPPSTGTLSALNSCTPPNHAGSRREPDVKISLTPSQCFCRIGSPTYLRLFRRFFDFSFDLPLPLALVFP